MVILPETHLARPRIPDPAAETRLCKVLIDAGYKVIDQDRIKDLRYTEQLDRIIKGDPKAKQETLQLGRRFGADLLITGYAFTQEISRTSVTTELGTVLRIRCEARIELKAIRMDTAEKIYADDIHKVGPPDATEELSSKACLGDAAQAISEGMLQKLDKLALTSTQHIDLEIRNIAGISLATDLEEEIAKLPGVLDVSREEFSIHTDRLDIHVEKKILKSFTQQLEAAKNLARFHMKVTSESGSKIIVECK